MKRITIITFETVVGGELDRIELSEVDATDYAIAEAAITLIQRTGMSLGAGDTVKIREDVRPGRTHKRFAADRNADRIDGYDRDDLGESPDY